MQEVNSGKEMKYRQKTKMFYLVAFSINLLEQELCQSMIE